MTDELPEIFQRLQPPPAPPELRPRVLAAVDRELARRPKPRWERALEWSVAACLVVGVGWNVLQWQSQPHWQSRTAASSSADGRQDLVETVASITDETTAQMLVDRLVSARRPGHGRALPLAGDPHGTLKN